MKIRGQSDPVRQRAAVLATTAKAQSFLVEFFKEYSMRSRLRAVFWFLLSLVILGLSATPGYWVADRLLLFGMATLLLTLSVFKIWEIWKSRGKPDEQEGKKMLGQLYLFPRSWQRWILDERESDEPGEP
jgi:hypothetical protein